MKVKKSLGGISRRKSIKIGAGLVVGMATTSILNGVRTFAMETKEKISPKIPDSGLVRQESSGNQVIKTTIDWIQDALVVTMPPAAAGGCQAGIYTPAENGVRPWRQALIRWRTNRYITGNSFVLVRQEGQEGGAGLSAIIDPNADYMFEVSVYNEAQDKDLKIWITVLDVNDRVLAEAPVKLISGDWALGQVSFSSGPLREIRCIVQSKLPLQLPCIYYVGGFHLTRKDYTWWNSQNLFNASRTAMRLQDERERLIQTLDPDVVAGHNGVYLNWDGFFTQRGIAIGGGQWEQEYDFMSINDPMLEQFRYDGMTRDLDGKEVHYNSKWPGYFMCHNAPGWHSYYKQRFTRIAPEVELLSQDNICTPSFLQGKKSCFCRSCKNSFRDWLNQCWSTEQFSAAGIDNPATLDIGDYVTKIMETRVVQARETVLSNPILRAYIQFNYVSQTNRWRETVAAAKQMAGHPIAICGNQYGAEGIRPYSVICSQISDITSVEIPIGGGLLTSQTRAWGALATKLGLAAGEYKRPVWLFLTSVFSAPQAVQSRLRMINSQARADGGVPLQWSTVAGSSSWFYDTEAQMSRFIQKHRELFARRDRYANVGLVYSLPTHVWRHFPSLGLSPEQYQQCFVTCAQLLEESHVPYEVNCWWPTFLGDDHISLERLKRYKVLVLPGVDCFTDAQREAVQTFQAQGGRVINVTCQTLYDADAVQRPEGQTLAIPGKHLIEIKPELLMSYSRTSEKSSPQTIREAKRATKKLRVIVYDALGKDQMLNTDAPSDVWTNVWLDETRQVLALHMVNGNIDEETDQFRSVKGSCWRLRLPTGLKVTKAVSISPEIPGMTKSIPVNIEKNWATVVVPSIECYTIVALYSGTALDEAIEKAKLQRSLWKQRITTGI